MMDARAGHIARVISERGGHIAEGAGVSQRSVRQTRYRLKKKGVVVLPRWRWTATDDKALITFIRENPAWFEDYWETAGAVIGLRDADRTRARARWLRRRRVPMPAIPVKPLHLRAHPPVKWTGARFAELVRLVRERGYDGAALALGETKIAIYNVILRKTTRRAKPGLRRIARPTKRDAEDAKFAEKAWAEFEALQKGREHAEHS